MIACLTVDVEQDCPPFLTTWRGIEEGLPRLLDLLDDERVAATCFVTGETARRYPESVHMIATRGHEIGCHGDLHRRFTSLDFSEGRDEIVRATDTLRRFGAIRAFRAPHLQLPRPFLPILESEGYLIDSSVGRHKSMHAGIERVGRLIRIPASVTSSTLRWPAFARRRLLARLQNPAVLFVHPWEFVDLRRERLRFDCRFRTGEAAAVCLRESIQWLRSRGATFARMCEVAERAGALTVCADERQEVV